MKIDRLLSIIVVLLDRDLVSARELAERFGVTVRTIQRDMDSIGLAGIPVYAVQGPRGGYGILESFKMDRRLVSVDDLYHIVTALRGVSDSMDDTSLENTLQKMQSLVPSLDDADLFARRAERLSIDFSMLGGDPRHRGAFRALRSAVERDHLVRFTYTNGRLEQTERTVEPMTVAFRWRSWYLFGWCRLREDYRLFRISRIRDLTVLDERFSRRSMRFDDFVRDRGMESPENAIEVVLKFHPDMRPIAEEFQDVLRVEADGSLITRISMPEDGWLYGFILSWGHFVEVLEPRRLRKIIADSAARIRSIYTT